MALDAMASEAIEFKAGKHIDVLVDLIRDAMNGDEAPVKIAFQRWWDAESMALGGGYVSDDNHKVLDPQNYIRQRLEDSSISFSMEDNPGKQIYHEYSIYLVVQPNGAQD